MVLCKAVHNICLPSPLQDMFEDTFTVMSLQNILCQALEKLGYHWYEGGRGGTPLAREGLHQTSIEVRSISSPAEEPLFTIYDKTLPRRCEAKDSEAKDSALIRVLIFIDQTLGNKNDDVNYVQCLLLANSIH